MLAAVVLAGLVLVVGLRGTTRIAGVAAVVAVSVLWLLVNEPMEGPLLLRITATHGVHGADLAGFAGLALAAFRVVALRRESHGPADPGGSRRPATGST
jgi:hypothetical protein